MWSNSVSHTHATPTPHPHLDRLYKVTNLVAALCTGLIEVALTRAHTQISVQCILMCVCFWVSLQFLQITGDTLPV